MKSAGKPISFNFRTDVRNILETVFQKNYKGTKRIMNVLA